MGLYSYTEIVHRCTTYFALLSYPGSSMRRQHGRECVHQLNVAILTRFCVAANASATVTTTCRLSLICLTLLTMISSTASRSTPVTYYSHICLTNSIYLTNSEPAHKNKTLINKTKLLNCSDFIVRMLYKYSY